MSCQCSVTVGPFVYAGAGKFKLLLLKKNPESFAAYLKRTQPDVQNSLSVIAAYQLYVYERILEEVNL